jgi:hypothetical protein
MNLLTNTVSLCEHCYRHVPAIRFERDGKIWLGKTCEEHGNVEHIIEPDSKFYKDFIYPRWEYKTYFIEVTNHCNLNCPHCYQIPNNSSINRSLEDIISQISNYPNDGYSICLAGAEPTVRKDLDQLIREINNLPGKPRDIIILTNGVNLSKIEYAKKFINIKNIFWTFGLNHPDYHGNYIRDKQLLGLQNCIDLGLNIKNISYTLEGLHQLEYCLTEILDFRSRFCEKFRIRVSADIGRNPKEPDIYLSQLVKSVQKICEKNNWTYKEEMSSGIRAHFPVYINDVYIKLIQWPNVKTIDLEEMQTETWADFLPGKPISSLIHQAILRDAIINKNITLNDTIPERFRR